MAQHILRKDLKKDEIRETFVRGAESVASHQQLLWGVIGAAIVIALAVFGWNSYTQRQTAKASAALDDAMAVFQARIRAPGEPAEPGELTYVAEKNKAADAERKFLEVAEASTDGRGPDKLARYYAALSAKMLLKDFPDAEKNLMQLNSGTDDNLAGLARFQLAGVYDQEGTSFAGRGFVQPVV